MSYPYTPSPQEEVLQESSGRIEREIQSLTYSRKNYYSFLRSAISSYNFSLNYTKRHPELNDEARMEDRAKAVAKCEADLDRIDHQLEALQAELVEKRLQISELQRKRAEQIERKKQYDLQRKQLRILRFQKALIACATSLSVVLAICICVLVGLRSGIIKTEKDFYRVHFSASMLENNHVGGDWDIDYIYNGEEFKRTKYFKCNPGKPWSPSFSVSIREEDSIDDVSTTNLSIPLDHDKTKYFYMTVQETNGRYAGSVAKWKITYSVKKLW